MFPWYVKFFLGVGYLGIAIIFLWLIFSFVGWFRENKNQTNYVNENISELLSDVAWLKLKINKGTSAKGRERQRRKK